VAIRRRLPVLVCTVICVLAGAEPSLAKKGGGLAPLTTAGVPTQPDVQRFIADSNAAARLGKALFWDMQAGSDGRTACASCHYDAGADSRSRNQVNPHGTTAFAANEQLTAADFPVESDRVVGSQGVLPSAFDGVTDGDAFELQRFSGADPIFNVGGANVRRVTGRNAPSAINAVFSFRSFWDGRAQNVFNGVSPGGTNDLGARVGQVNASGGIDKVAIAIANSSLASQATGPPGSPVEMSADGRTLSDIGKKLLTLRPLGTQEVSGSDSLLGALASPAGRGLDASYADLIREAFQPEWWNGSGAVTAPNGRAYSLMQFNFPLFWGLAIQAYESRLVSDGTPFDRFLSGDQSAMDPLAQEGMGVFSGKGDCMECHVGAALTDATGTGPSDEGPAGGETGFHNIGVRSPGADPGLANATFKTPGLRNVELTGPYFHNGGKATLRQVVDFYSIGGDFPAELKNLSLSEQEKDALVAFLKSLTDPRVRDQSAPFDHPQLLVPAGAQTGGNGLVVKDAAGRALDCFKEVPVTGAAGGRALARFLELTGPPCFTPPPRAVPAKASGPAVSITVPSVSPFTSRSCKSRRNFTVRVYRPRGDRIKRVTVLVNGRRVADLRNGRTHRARVDLRGLAKGVVRVKIVARTAKGREIVTLRKYRTCSR
jgi:cytochrome c peroxidase